MNAESLCTEIRFDSRSHSWCFALLRVSPTLVNEFDTVAIRVEYIGSVVARVIVESGGGCAIVGGSRCDCGSIGGVDQIPVTDSKADMRGAAVHGAFTKPEEQATICTKAFEIAVSRRPILTVEVKTLMDAKGRQCRFVKRDRAFRIAPG